jgi:hypothetical protein
MGVISAALTCFHPVERCVARRLELLRAELYMATKWMINVRVGCAPWKGGAFQWV